MLPIAIVLLVLAAVLGSGQDSGGLVPSAREWVVNTLSALSMALLFPAGLATLDRFSGAGGAGTSDRRVQEPRTP